MKLAALAETKQKGPKELRSAARFNVALIGSFDIFLFLRTRQRTMIKSYGSAARFNVRIGGPHSNFINFSIIRNISKSGGTYQILWAFGSPC